MLSDREHRALQEIELRLAGEDQRFSSAMNRPLTATNWLRYGYDATIAVSLLAAVLCFALWAEGTAGAGVVATLLAVVAVHARATRFGRGTHSSAKSLIRIKSLMKKIKIDPSDYPQ